MTAEEMDELELLGEPEDWGGLRLARLREQRNLFDQLTAEVELEHARGQGTAGLHDKVEELREAVAGLETALEQTREAVLREETSRMDKLHEAEQTRKDILDIQETKQTLIARSTEEIANREKRHLAELAEITKPPELPAEEKSVVSVEDSDKDEDDSVPGTVESENDDDPSENPRALRMQIWGQVAAKKVDELYDFFSGRGPKGG